MLQPLNALVRGRPGARTIRRALWRFAHKGAGYAVLGVGVYEALSGRSLMPSQGDAILDLYVVLLGLSFGVLAGGAHGRARLPAGGEETGGKGDQMKASRLSGSGTNAQSYKNIKINRLGTSDGTHTHFHEHKELATIAAWRPTV